MPHAPSEEVIVVGAGPNGLAAAITMARAGCSVVVYEANDQVGGGVRSGQLTLPGFIHDLCSAVHPFGEASPFFRQLPLDRHGLAWIHPELPLAHPLDNGRAALLHRSTAATADAMAEDSAAYLRLMNPLVDRWQELLAEILQPPLHIPLHPLLLARFGVRAVQSASRLIRSLFKGEAGRALVSGLAAHSFLPLEQAGSAAFGLVLGLMGHAAGWPMPRGGSGRLAEALEAHLLSLGGRVITGHRVEDIDELPPARALLLDVTPRQFLRMAAHRMPARYRRALEGFRYGPAAFKVDFALTAPIPWNAPECTRAGTVHVGGTFEEVARSERAMARGQPPEHPFVLLVQPSLFDPTRAPDGFHTAWAYCHVPHSSSFDMSRRIEAQIERFAPGFQARILARHITTPQQLEARNSNLVGGDINGGLASLRQILARPVLSGDPYRTPLKGIYLCSASTPPGGGVHGMAGYQAAGSALRHEFGRQTTWPEFSPSASLTGEPPKSS
jgi:phytoene dehydrogenase-like protein